MRALLRSPATVLLFFLAACGGEASDGGYSPPIDYGEAPGLELSLAAVRFAIQDGAPDLAPVTIEVAVDASEVTGLHLEFPQDYVPPFVSYTLTGSAGSWTLKMQTDRLRAPRESVHWTFRVVATRANGAMVAFRTVESWLDKTPGLWPDRRSVGLTVKAGTRPTTGVPVWVTGLRLSFTSTADQPWVVLNQLDTVMPAVLRVGADATALTPGTYTAKVKLAAEGLADEVAVTLTVVPP